MNKRLEKNRRRQQAQLKVWSVVLQISAFFCWGIGLLTAVSQAAVLARRLRGPDVDPYLREAINPSAQSFGSWEILLVIAVALVLVLIAFVAGAVLMALAHALLTLGRLEVQTRHPPSAWASTEFPEPAPGPYSRQKAADG